MNNNPIIDINKKLSEYDNMFDIPKKEETSTYISEPTKTRFCPNCGMMLTDDSSVCPSCGEPVD